MKWVLINDRNHAKRNKLLFIIVVINSKFKLLIKLKIVNNIWRYLLKLPFLRLHISSKLSNPLEELVICVSAKAYTLILYLRISIMFVKTISPRQTYRLSANLSLPSLCKSISIIPEQWKIETMKQRRSTKDGHLRPSTLDEEPPSLSPFSLFSCFFFFRKIAQNSISLNLTSNLTWCFFYFKFDTIFSNLLQF